MVGPVGEWCDRFGASLRVQTEARMRWSAVDDVRASHGRRTLNDTFVRVLTRDHLLLTPTLTAPPLSVKVEASEEIAGREITRLGGLAFTFPLPRTGSPAATVPCGWTRASLPVGWYIAPPHLADRLVWRVAAACAAIAPWAHTRPSLDGASTSYLER
jgi:Asp-tRNA(Asn)/Glu-tRNA(Gln) amidotransferase A subunit family amidase